MGAAICLALWGCEDGASLPSFEVRSPAFEDGAFIPTRHTCDGLNQPVPLWLDDAPDETVSYALLLEDRDAREGVFTHWLVWNIPPDTGFVDVRLMVTEKQVGVGVNDWGNRRYEGPCLSSPASGEPDPGVHRYHFVAYALDTMLQISPKSTRTIFDEAIRGHVLAKGELTGRYE